MNLTDPKQLKSLLSRFHIRPDDRLGQNFLISQEVLEQILSAAELTKNDVVLEIGAGIGTLTRELLSRCKLVIAYELDRALIKPLKLVLGDANNLKIVQGDFLKADAALLDDLARGGGFKVVANIPYYITGQIIKKLLQHGPESIILLLQHEVAERICAAPGQLSLLALSVQYFGTPRLTGIVPKESFFPDPQVDSAILKITLSPKQEHKVGPGEFFKIARIGFSARRKTLLNNLSAGFHLSKSEAEKKLLSAGISPNQRAQELSIAQWEQLAGMFRTK